MGPIIKGELKSFLLSLGSIQTGRLLGFLQQIPQHEHLIVDPGLILNGRLPFNDLNRLKTLLV